MGAWLPIALLPGVVLLSCNRWPAWALMWALALSIFAGLKWLTLVSFPAAHRASIWRILGYVFLWPGLNADSFLSVNRKTTLALQEYVWAAAKTAAGALILLIAAPRALTSHPLAAGWLGMFGLVLILHFGIFHWLSLAWRTLGISAPPDELPTCRLFAERLLEPPLERRLSRRSTSVCLASACTVAWR